MNVTDPKFYSRPTILFIGLNPSVADAEKDDPTIRRERRFATDWGYYGRKEISGAKFSEDKKHRFVLYRPEFTKVNLYSQIATDPADLSPDVDFTLDCKNFDYILSEVKQNDMVVCAWGSHKHARDRSSTVYDIIKEAGKQPYAIKLTKGGCPSHPLYLPANLEPFAWKLND